MWKLSPFACGPFDGFDVADFARLLALRAWTGSNTMRTLSGTGRPAREGATICRATSQGFTGLFETGGKRWVLKLFFEITVEIGLVHRPARSGQSHIRSRAVLKSRAGMAWPL